MRDCQKNKLFRKSKVPLKITDTPDKPFKKVCARYCRASNYCIISTGNKYVLTFQDNLTKFSKAIHIPNQETATVAKKFTTKLVLEYGIPEEILTDQGTTFTSNMFKTCANY